MEQTNVADFPLRREMPMYRTERAMKKIVNDIEEGKATEEEHSAYQFKV